MGEWDNEGDLWNCPQLAACGNDNTQQWWKWVWKHGGDAETVAKKGLLVAFQAKCYNTRVLQHQSATTPECHQCTKVVPPAWRSFGGTQKHGWRLEEHKRSSRRNGNGDSEEIQTVIREKYKHRRHGELGLDWEEMGGVEENWILLSGKSIWELPRGKKSPIIISSLSGALFFPLWGKMRRSQLNGLIRESEASLSSKRHKT